MAAWTNWVVSFNKHFCLFVCLSVLLYFCVFVVVWVLHMLLTCKNLLLWPQIRLPCNMYHHRGLTSHYWVQASAWILLAKCGLGGDRFETWHSNNDRDSGLLTVTHPKPARLPNFINHLRFNKCVELRAPTLQSIVNNLRNHKYVINKQLKL